MAIDDAQFDQILQQNGVNTQTPGSGGWYSQIKQAPVTPPRGGISLSTTPTDNSQPVKPPFEVNTDTFGFKDIPAGVGATLGNAVAAPATAVQQAVRIPGQVKDIFTQNGGQGAYGKYSEGVMSIMDGINKAIFDPIVSGVTTVGNTAGGLVNKLIPGSENSSLGQQGDQALGNIGKNTSDFLKGISKFGIEQPTTAALALQQGYQKLSGNPQADLIHEVGGRTIDAASKIAQPIIDKATELAQPATDYIKEKANNLANSLEKESLRLTPQQKAKLGGRLGEITQFNIDNDITGSPQTRLSKIKDVVNTYNERMDNFLKNEAPDNVIDTQMLKDRLNNLKIKYSASDEADLAGAAKQIDNAVSRLDQYGDAVPTSRLNNLKSSVYDQAYGNQIGSGITDDVQSDIARVYKEAIQDNLQGKMINGQSVADFNHDYGNAITSQKILNAAVGKPQIGPIGRIGAKVAGAAIGSSAGIPGEIIGGLYGDKAANILMGTHARSIISELLAGGKDESSYLPDIQSTDATTMSSNIPNTVINPSISPNDNPVNDGIPNKQGGFIKNPFASDEGTQTLQQNIDQIMNPKYQPNPDLQAQNVQASDQIQNSIVDKLQNTNSGENVYSPKDIEGIVNEGKIPGAEGGYIKNPFARQTDTTGLQQSVDSILSGVETIPPANVQSPTFGNVIKGILNTDISPSPEMQNSFKPSSWQAAPWQGKQDFNGISKSDNKNQLAFASQALSGSLGSQVSGSNNTDPTQYSQQMTDQARQQTMDYIYDGATHHNGPNDASTSAAINNIAQNMQSGKSYDSAISSPGPVPNEYLPFVPQMKSAAASGASSLQMIPGVIPGAGVALQSVIEQIIYAKINSISTKDSATKKANDAKLQAAINKAAALMGPIWGPKVKKTFEDDLR